jgi:excisionase family DNA binding protein
VKIDDSRAPLPDTDAVAEFLGVPSRTLVKWRSEGTGPRSHRVGRHIRYIWAEVDEWLAAQASREGPVRGNPDAA